jgi:hypothetical protein
MVFQPNPKTFLNLTIHFLLDFNNHPIIRPLHPRSTSFLDFHLRNLLNYHNLLNLHHKFLQPHFPHLIDYQLTFKFSHQLI